MLFGGECNCFNFVLMFKEGGNLLLFDEFINDLDVEMLSFFENVLFEFFGCVVVIMYDWWFFDCIVMYIFVYEGIDEKFD